MSNEWYFKLESTEDVDRDAPWSHNVSLHFDKYSSHVRLEGEAKDRGEAETLMSAVASLIAVSGRSAATEEETWAQVMGELAAARGLPLKDFMREMNRSGLLNMEDPKIKTYVEKAVIGAYDEASA